MVAVPWECLGDRVGRELPVSLLARSLILFRKVTMGTNIPSSAPGQQRVPLRLMAITRLSTSGQQTGHGRARQADLEIKAFAKELGAEIVETRSVEERATIFDRPQFEAVMAEATALRQHGDIDGLILGSVDRLSRDPYDGGALVKMCLMSGLLVYFAAERLDASKEGDQERIIGALVTARAYADRVKRQTMPARLACAAAGKLPNGQCRWPFNYDPKTGRATPNLERATWIKRWVELLLQGGHLGDISRMMETSGVSAPRGGIRWGRSTIAPILGDEALKGEFYHRRERMHAPNFYETSKRIESDPELIYLDKRNAILDDITWAFVQKRFADNQEQASRNTRQDYGPLHRLVLCVRLRQ